LPKPAQWLHLTALILVILSTIIVIAVPAYQRIGERGSGSTHFRAVTHRLAVSALMALVGSIRRRLFRGGVDSCGFGDGGPSGGDRRKPGRLRRLVLVQIFVSAYCGRTMRFPAFKRLESAGASKGW
jgi:hypothetical protein